MEKLDLYDLNSRNTKMYEDHEKAYDDLRVASIGCLLDELLQQIGKLEREREHLKGEIDSLKDEVKSLSTPTIP